MSKDEEEILIGIVALFFLFQILNANSSTASALGIAKIQSATDLGYVNAGTTLASNLVDDFTD
jgi:hypothetical protein